MRKRKHREKQDVEKTTCLLLRKKNSWHKIISEKASGSCWKRPSSWQKAVSWNISKDFSPDIA